MGFSSFKLKILLIGPETGSKNSLIQKIFSKCYQANYKLTVGVDILVKDVEFKPGEIATLSIWEVAPQERFKFIRGTFYKGAVGVLLIFDIIKEQTYEEIRDWFKEINKFAGFIPFILVGNSVKLLNLINKRDLREKAHNFARDKGGTYIETSPMNVEDIEVTVQKFTLDIIESRI